MPLATPVLNRVHVSRSLSSIAAAALLLGGGLAASADEVTAAGAASADEVTAAGAASVAAEASGTADESGALAPPAPDAAAADAASTNEGPWAPPDPGGVPIDAQTGQWIPPELDDSEKDWIKLTSGEWLTGELHRMRDGDLEFESDELGLLTLDFSDLEEFRSPRPHIYRFEGKKIYRGSAGMKNGKIRIKTLSTGGVVEFDRRKLVNVVPGDGAELDYWAFRLGAGVTARSGNTDQTDISGSASLRRGTALTRWTSTYNGAFSTVSGDTNENNHRVKSLFDVFVTRNFYVTTPYFEYFTDRFQNIDLRVTPGFLAGYELLDVPWLTWDIRGGPAYQRTVFTEVVTGSRKENDFAFITGTTLAFDFPRDIDLDSTYQVQVIPTDMDKTSHHWLTTLSFEIWGPLDLDVSFTLDRIERPTRDSSGDRPDSNDYRLAVGLGVEWP